jgi:hypothetical protein
MKLYKKKLFRSRVSVLVIIFFLTLFVPTLISIINQKTYNELYPLGGILIFITSILCGIRYIIIKNEVYIRIFWIIPFGKVNVLDIISVERSYNPLSSPAASLNKLHISYKKDFKCNYLLISPIQEKEFINILKKINSNIHVHVNDKKSCCRIWEWDV